MYQRASELAERDQVSVDNLVTGLVNAGIDEWDDWARLQALAARGSIAELKTVLAKVKDVPPDENDRLR